MSALLYRLGHFCVRHHRAVLAVWAVIFIGLITLTAVIGKPTNSNVTLDGTGSTEATNLLADKLPKDQNGTVPIVLVAKSGTLDKGANAKAVKATTKSLANQEDVIKAVSPLSDKGSDALSKDKTIGYISVTLSEGPDSLSVDEAEAVFDATKPGSDAGLEVSAGGYLGQQLSKPATESSEADRARRWR